MHTLGQVAHFVGDYRETATHFPGAGGFDGGVEGKQVGLFGDAVDHPDHAVDFLAVFGQFLDHFGGLLYPTGQPGDRTLYPGDHCLAAAGEGVGGLRQVTGGACVLGDVVDGGGHFVDGGGGLVGFALLAQHAVLHLVHAAGQACGAVVQLPGGACHGIDHALVTGLHGVEGAGHLADFILAGQRHSRRQVTSFFNVQHYILEGVELTEQEADQQLRGAEHG
ncbi:hypothetical protein PFLmoz3_04386 [Pseudomonas fluorescens]|uniref:Uncharacterized protein n=1 Tax=Pseudomonas fluorescens TaxID=294 RepID=A0A125QHY3_PSEFL|nr:hypothetical protein PFLmoz3_04386 [Pseudomonas fluorescens]